ncbi:unnamed protein product [Eruca vesicaria subsp. sativa]|uniref:Uncharacterized protein n=1 Tax=Eruca vesicaria subsp. sativa TaxID=29727 RepID=A0ABC8K6F6_ERUVS|nr:unnamed protein product [Eruca vesicaria subsp. sativa]
MTSSIVRKRETTGFRPKIPFTTFQRFQTASLLSLLRRTEKKERKNTLYLWTLKVEVVARHTSIIIIKLRTIIIRAESNDPRISFPSDLGQSDKAPPPMEQQQQPSGGLIWRDTTLLDSSNQNFEFHISRTFDPSPADEILADGVILPFQVTTASVMPKGLYKYQ